MSPRPTNTVACDARTGLRRLAATPAFGTLSNALRATLTARGGAILAVGFALSVSVAEAAAAASGAPSVLATLWKWTPLIAEGFALNLIMSFLAMGLGTIVGGLLGIGQLSPIGFVRRISWLITQFSRNAPWLVLLFYCMYLLPFQLNIFGLVIPFPAWIKATLGLTLALVGNISEIVRGGILSIPRAQWEAAESLAFSRRQILFKIILPQCARRMLPPWMNWYSMLIMATPLTSVVGVHDALGYASAAIAAEGRHELLAPMYLYIMAWFFIYSYPITQLTLRLERRIAVQT